MPRAAATLGFELLDMDAEAGTIEVAFTATEDFTNPSGNVLGAFLAAMLYDTVGPALLATLDADQFQSTLELKASFLRPARPGRAGWWAAAGSSTGSGTWRSWRRRWPTRTGRW